MGVIRKGKVNIVLSPSQQWWNVCSEGDSEQDHCFVIAQRVFEYLKYYDVNAFIVPKLHLPEKESLTEAVKISNDFIRANGGKPSFHLDIHTDGGYSGSGASGFYVSEAGKSFIMQVYKETAKITPWGDGTVRERSLFVLERTIAVAGLLEISFHDIVEQAKWIHSSVDMIAKASVKGFENGCGIEKVAEVKHWAEDAYQKLVDDGRYIIDRRFDAPMTRGEYFVLEAQKIK